MLLLFIKKITYRCTEIQNKNECTPTTSKKELSKIVSPRSKAKIKLDFSHIESPIRNKNNSNHGDLDDIFDDSWGEIELPVSI